MRVNLMKINDMNRIGAMQQYRKSSVSDAGLANSKNKLGKDQLHISDEAKQLQGAGRSESIQELKQSVESGNYHVDAEKLAERLLPYFK